MYKQTLIILILLASALLQAEAIFTYQPNNPFRDKSPIFNQTSKASENKANRQLIQIEAQVLEVSQSDISNYNIDLSLENNHLKAQLDTLLSIGSAHIIAKPRISTLEGEEASIQIGDKIPYAVPAGDQSNKWTVQYLDTGVKLKITPVISGKYIMVRVKPEVSLVSQWKTNQSGTFPIISTRESQTQVKVKNNEPIIIGGLINEQEQESISSIPILGDIPIIGGLFQSSKAEKISTDIIFIITPKIITF